ncbi:hypothetical protein [Photobacterium sanguinicancri]|uniref:Lipoprotein n=1 Tax=Photobacterium sanguinicancri TaxID=875932 RepID=A0ABX4FZR8_9GAMM|nr:hypothetical protein [Photobacterium sanguinicancri]OZS44267.1 hypothetical protein ASV53_08885 [Photobacterium sanguinicancri]
MIITKSTKQTLLVSIVLSLTLLSGCSQGPAVVGTEAVLVPLSTELKIGAKTNRAADQNKVYLRARDFVITQFDQGAEKVVITAVTKKGKQLQAKMKRNLGKYQQWIDYKIEVKPHSSTDLFLVANRTQVLIPPCQPLGQYNAWDQQDGCFSERARNKQLATPSTLMPVVSEMTIEQREGH